MTEQHPISMPSPELAAKWVHEIYGNPVVIPLHKPTLQVIEHAVRWGADQELEACCEWLKANPELVDELRADRRPKPPSLKEQALQALALLKVDASTHGLGFDSSTIRRALEQLPDHK